ncbi:hypothetical protein RR48_14961 [Papilio machaon]|uniref:Uncharacterized protein n=1 Tax=Papilio machaon TaxID=76193 RepID=A0A194R0U3_PAPMA|nr:hypothetical protein RR48_14961 [Papilio machaon]
MCERAECAERVGRLVEARGGRDCASRTMLSLVFAVWSAARALGWSCDLGTTPDGEGDVDAEEAPVLPRLRSARASSDLSTLSTTTTSSSQTSSGDHSKRSTNQVRLPLLKRQATFVSVV